MALGICILLLSFVVAFIAVKVLKPLACWAELVDKPGGRKKHCGAIPLVGGLAIYISVLITTLVFLDEPIFIRLFLIAGGLIVFMGMLDDRYELSATFRLAGQLLISCLFVYGLDVHIQSFGYVLGLVEFKLGWLGYPLAVLSLMGAINAFNMLDGMDGLVGALFMVTLTGLVALFAISGDVNLQLLCTSFIGAVGAFLIFNIWGKPQYKRIKKVFMGDAGSMFLGLVVGVIIIQGSQKSAPAFLPVTALWLVLLPMTDMFTIMYRRMRRGKSPMAPDRTHIHHILLRAGFSKTSTLFVMVLMQVFCVLMGVLTAKTGFSEVQSFSLLVVTVMAYQLFIRNSWKLIRWNKRRLLSQAQILLTQ